MKEELIDAISRCSAAVEARIADLLPRKAGDALSDCLWYHLSVGGKKLRPALCLLTCEALGGRTERALDFAAAVELLHNALLVHDDIEDGDEMRRDQPALWVKYGIANALNTGDYLLGAAYAAVLRAPGPAELKGRLMVAFNDAFLRTVEGQALDIRFRADPDFTLDKYQEMVELKTGFYLALGMVGGAMIAQASDGTIERLWRFGKYAGPAFQVRDDVLDLTPGKGRGGKIGSDIEEGKASILYAHALSVAPPDDRQRLIRIMSLPRKSTPPDDVRWVMGLYEECGTLDFARRYAAERLALAKAEIRSLPLVANELLAALTDYMIERRS